LLQYISIPKSLILSKQTNDSRRLQDAHAHEANGSIIA
jgi:hypothetical protein